MKCINRSGINRSHKDTVKLVGQNQWIERLFSVFENNNDDIVTNVSLSLDLYNNVILINIHLIADSVF